MFGGLAILAYTGFGGGDTDITAHVAGFGCGLLLGLLAGWRWPGRLGHLGMAGQWLCGMLALGLLTMAWLRAGAVTG